MKKLPLALAAIALAAAPARADHGDAALAPLQLRALLDAATFEGDDALGRYRIRFQADGRAVREDRRGALEGSWRAGDAGYCETFEGRERCGPATFDGNFLVVTGDIATAMTAVSGAALKREAEAPLHLISISGVGERIGALRLSVDGDALVVAPDAGGLTPGPHALHVHERGDCGPALKDGAPVAGLAAGGHYDPRGAGHHDHGDGTLPLGDLPEMTVGSDGMARTPIRSTSLRLYEVLGRAIMVHAYGEAPPAAGMAPGGGARIACAIVPR